MKAMERKPVVSEIKPCHREKAFRNVNRNRKMVEFHQKLLAESIVSAYEINAMREQLKRLDSCNKFWSVETYEESRVRVLLRTYLCKNRFCNNCNQIRKYVLKERFLPYMEKYKDFLYHIVLTVPDCNGGELRDTLWRMSRCFKTLVNYLNGNKKVKGVDLSKYGFKGCIRTLEVNYNGDVYHPHFHIAAVLGDSGIGEKYVSNRFSGACDRLFSDFEIIIQRIWWLLLNGKRLTYDNIFGEDCSFGRYSCIADKFQNEDYEKLFGYMTKMYSDDKRFMSYGNFKTLYYALSRVRQIQGYGVFYNAKELNSEAFSEREYKTLESYLTCDEEPVGSYEPLSRLANDDSFTILKERLKK